MIKRFATGALVVLALLLGMPALAAPMMFSTTLSGAAEAPPNASPGTGFAVVIFDPDADTMRVIAQFSELMGITTAAHIHCCTTTPLAGTAGVATMVPSFTGFPLGVTSGSFDETYDLADAATWNPAFVTASGGIAQAEARLLSGLLAGQAYFNVHTAQFPSGEIRGFLLVPEPSTLALLAICIAALAARRRRAP